MYSRDMSEYASLFYVKQITPYFSGLKPCFIFLTIFLIWIDLCDSCTQVSDRYKWICTLDLLMCWWFVSVVHRLFLKDFYLDCMTGGRITGLHVICTFNYIRYCQIAFN